MTATLRQTVAAPSPLETSTSSLVRRSLAATASRARTRMLLALVAALAVTAAFLLWGALDAWALIAPIRAKRLLALAVVAAALACSTVVFQVVTRNRILSPSVMGFDALFALVATSSIYFLTSTVVNRASPTLIFLGQAGLMTALAVSLFTLVLRRGRNNVHLLVLVGIVVGYALRALTNLMSLVMDPNEYLTVQDRTMATFSVLNTGALWVTVAVTLLGLVVMLWRARTWDVLALGPDVATSLGLNYSREVKVALTLSSVLVAAATALVGPLTFFGLLVVNIAVFALRSAQLRYLLPTAAAMGVVVLVGGQAILEHALNQATVLPVVIEFLGGAMLLAMIVKESRR